MAVGLLVLPPAWADRSAWLWHLLDSPSQKAQGGQQGRASSRHGRSVPQAEPRGCQDVSLGGSVPQLCSQAAFNTCKAQVGTEPLLRCPLNSLGRIKSL